MENEESRCNTKNDDGKPEQKTRSSGSTFDFDKKTWATDFTLIVEGKTLYVTKAVLGLASPVFERMFQSDSKEVGPKEMELPGKSFTDVLEFLRCIYPNSPTSVNRKNVLKILPLAEGYQVSQLKSSCEHVLLACIDDYSSAERLCEVLNLACLYNLKKLREKGIQLLSSKQKDKLDIANAKNELPAEVMVEILQRINTRMEETNAVLVSHMQNNLAENEMLRKEIKILKRIWSVKETPELNHSRNWKGETLVMDMNRVHTSQKYATVKRQISIWDVNLIVMAKVCPQKKTQLSIY